MDEEILVEVFSLNKNKMGMAGFEPESFALEANILAKLYYIPKTFLEKRFIKKTEGNYGFNENVKGSFN